jgi:hypothetical protein
MPYAYCYLLELYPKREGWKHRFADRKNFLLPDFIIDKVIGKCVERVIVSVQMDTMISKKHIEEMKIYEKVMRVSRNYHIKKIFFVPSGCEVISMPDDIKVIFLKEFSLKSA